METEKVRVLVIDDDPVMLRSVKAVLDERYQVILANSGTRVVAMMEKKRPDVVLLDYEMPECDGAQTLTLIREREEFREIPVYFLTGLGDPKQIEKIMSFHPFGYIVKPAAKDKLIEAIEMAVQA